MNMAVSCLQSISTPEKRDPRGILYMGMHGRDEKGILVLRDVARVTLRLPELRVSYARCSHRKNPRCRIPTDLILSKNASITILALLLVVDEHRRLDLLLSV